MTSAPSCPHRIVIAFQGHQSNIDVLFQCPVCAALKVRQQPVMTAPSKTRVPVPACRVQNRAVRNLFTAPNMIEDVALTMRQLKGGDLKLRVRALEAERALDRVQVGGDKMKQMKITSFSAEICFALRLPACTHRLLRDSSATAQLCHRKRDRQNSWRRK